MWHWIVTYVPLGEDKIRIKTKELLGSSKQEVQRYFSRYYKGRVIGIEKKV